MQRGVLRFVAAALAVLFPRQAIVGSMLGRHDQRRGPHRDLVLIGERNLALGVGFEERRRARMPVGGHALEDLVRVMQRRGHQRRRLIAGIAEHDALVAGALILVAAGIDTLRDMRRLRVEMVLEVQVLPVEAALLIADMLDRRAHRGLDFLERAGRPVACGIDHARAPHLARQHDEVGGGQRLARDARFGVLGEEQIDDRVRNLVGDLIGMPLRDRFAGEQIRATRHVERSVA